MRQPKGREVTILGRAIPKDDIRTIASARCWIVAGGVVKAPPCCDAAGAAADCSAARRASTALRSAEVGTSRRNAS